MMSQRSKRELLEKIRLRYLKAKRSEKETILDEFVAVTSYHRKYATRILKHGRTRQSGKMPAWTHFQATILLENYNPLSECEKTLRSSVEGEHLNTRFEPKTENQPVNHKKSRNSLSQRAFKQAADLQFPYPIT